MTKNLIGQRFGKLTVVGLSDERSKERRRMWICQCDCGKTKIVNTKSLTTESIKSYGGRGIKGGHYGTR